MDTAIDIVVVVLIAASPSTSSSPGVYRLSVGLAATLALSRNRDRSPRRARPMQLLCAVPKPLERDLADTAFSCRPVCPDRLDLADRARADRIGPVGVRIGPASAAGADAARGRAARRRSARAGARRHRSAAFGQDRLPQRSAGAVR